MITTLLVSICLAFSSPGDIDTKAYRQSFFSIDSEEEAVDFELFCRDHAQDSPVGLAYAGWSKTRLAEFGMNPFSKWSHFSEGRDQIEEAIALEENNPEIRLIRLSIQLHAPDFLGYNSQIEFDKQKVVSALKSGWLQEDALFKKQVIQFMMELSDLSESEKAALKAL